MNDCRKMYMVFAPRFEITEEELDDGCFLTAGVGPGDTIWSVDGGLEADGRAVLHRGRPSEERVLLLAGGSPTQITVQRGYESSTPGSWPAGTRMKKLPPISGFQSDVEWGATISNIAVTGDASLKVGGDAARIEESDARCKYTGFWEDYKYGAAGWPSQWWSKGHAKRTAPERYRGRARGHDQATRNGAARSLPRHVPEHGLRQGRVTVDGVAPPIAHRSVPRRVRRHDGEREDRAAVPAGNHTVVLTALFDKNAASTGYYFYFDYLWPLVPQDVPDAQKEYPDVSLAIDFDTDHGYKKPPAWHLWHLQKLGFKGHADVYMGVFWNNKRRRVGATLSVRHRRVLRRLRRAGDVVSISIGGTTIAPRHRVGESLQEIVNQMRALINAVLRRVGRRQLRDQHHAPHPVQGSVVDVPRPGGRARPTP